MKKLLLVVLCLMVFITCAFAGVEWTTTITTQSTNKKNNNQVIAHVVADKGMLKQTFTSVSKDNQIYSQDVYMLFNAENDTITVVNTKRKTFMYLDLDSLLQLTGAFGQLIKITISDNTATSETLPDETIAGLHCNHVKVTTDYTMKVKIVFIKKSMEIHEVKEIWATEKMPGIETLSKSFLKKDYRTGIPDLDAMIQREIERQKKLGFPLKTITTTITKGKKGKIEEESTTTTEISNIKTGSYPASTFAIPSDYKQEQAPQEGGPKLF